MPVGDDYTALRHRKKSNALPGHSLQSTTQKLGGRRRQDDVISLNDSQNSAKETKEKLWWWVNTIIGLALMLICSGCHGYYARTMHENNLWFSNIQEVEREISFRTESGLYYSYYKQLVSAPSLLGGINSLIHDNITEHPDCINVLARMNIYQEVTLAILYRIIPGLQRWLPPVYFYINTVFALHILLVWALYTMAWVLSGTWLSGVLAAMFYIFNKADTTRVETYIPLRESFSLPFLWIQLTGITVYFGHSLSTRLQRLTQNVILISTFLFALTWQFNQFALLLQAMAVFAVQILLLVDRRKILFVYVAQGSAMLIVCVLQFFNPMILGGLLLSFIASALVIMWIQGYERQGTPFVLKFLRLLGYVILVFLLMMIFNRSMKFLVQQEADEHINKFVLSKFGFETSRDFDVRLYLCNGAFTFLTFDVFERLSTNLVFPFYAVTHFVLLISVAVAAIKILWSNDSKSAGFLHLLFGRPELAYHAVQTVFFGAVAMIAIRMKYFWTPYMCVLASVGLADYSAWSWILSRLTSPSRTMVNVVRSAAVVLVSVSLLMRALPNVLKELENLSEFYDPDTVQLMEWIKSNTSTNASFTGSMQLLAGVKLCTGRPITNHPHYEDKHLRQKTKELYQIYGRRLPEDVYKILHKYASNYIILEDSICLAPSRDGCRLPDLIDVDNGIVPDSGSPAEGLARSEVPRFCNEIRYATKAFTQFFKLVFQNKTFRVYQVLL